MKKRVSTKVISGILAFVMMVSTMHIAMPMAVFASKDDVNNLGENPENYIGMGYNASIENSITVNNINKTNWLDLAKAKDNDYIFTMGDGLSVITGTSDAFYSESSSSLLLDFGINYSSSNTANFPIEVAKIGVESKFEFNTNFSKETTNDEMYYVYNYRAVMNQFALDATKYQSALSNDFLIAVKNLGDNPSDEAIANFFETYGTHMLVSYEQGCSMTYTAWQIAKNDRYSINETLAAEMKASGSIVGDIGVSSAQSVNQKLNIEESSDSLDKGMKITYNGGETNYQNALSSTMDEENQENWVDSAIGKGVFLPETSKWVSVWEVLPYEAQYKMIREALEDYFLEKAEKVNNEFMTRFCKFDERITLNDYTYVSQNGYVFQNVPVLIGEGETNKISSNSYIILNHKVNTDLLPAEEIDFVVDSSFATIDNNIIAVNNVDMSASGDKTFKLQIKAFGITIKEILFEVESETNDGFYGGYGDAYRPYLIKTVTQLNKLAESSSLAGTAHHYMLIDDINIGGIDFAGIPSFAGVFDGNGHKVYNFGISCTGSVGLFKEIKENATVKNLTVGDINTTTFDGYSVLIDDGANAKNEYAGGIAGVNLGTIENCSVVNTKVIAYSEYDTAGEWQHSMAGGISGLNKGKIAHCAVRNSYVWAWMKSEKDNNPGRTHSSAGGIAGRTEVNASIDKCVSSGTHLEAYAYSKDKNDAFTDWHEGVIETLTGGIVGYYASNTDYLVTNCVSYNNTYTTSYGTDGSDSDDGTNVDSKGIIIAWNNTSHVAANDCYGIATDNVTVACGRGTATGCTLKTTLDEIEVSGMVYSENDFDPVTVNDIILTNSKSEIPEGMKLNLSGVSLKDTYTGIAPENAFVNTSVFCVNDIASYDPSVLGSKSFSIVTYAGKTLTLNIATILKEIIDVKIIDEARKTNYFVGDAADIGGLSLSVRYNTGEVVIIDNTDEIAIVSFDTSTKGAKKAQISYGGKTVEFEIVVYEVLPEEITVADSSTHQESYILGESFSTDGFTFTVKYNNNTYKNIGADQVTFVGFDSTNEGNKIVKATYSFTNSDGISGTLSCDVALNVGVISKIEIDTQPVKTTYFTSDKDIDLTGLVLKVTYSNGVVKYVKNGYKAIVDYNMSEAGRKLISVTYSGISIYDNEKIVIDVVDPELTQISINMLPKTSYYIGDTFSVSGLALLRYYNDESTPKAIYSGYDFQVSGFDMNVMPTFNTTGEKIVTIYYTENNVRKAVSYNITILPIVLEKIEVTQSPYKTIYKENEVFDASGLVVTAIFSNRSEQVTNYTYSQDPITKDTKNITVYFSDKSVDVPITVVFPTRIAIRTLPERLIYEQFEILDTTGMIVDAIYYDGSKVQLQDTEYMVDTNELTELGTVRATVSYGDLTDSFDVTVNEIDVTDKPQFVIESKNAIIGKEVTVQIALKNNPGIASMKLNVAYDDSILTLTKIEYNSAIGGQSQQPQSFDSPVVLNWINGTADSDGDFVFATLTFVVSETAVAGTLTDIAVTYDENDVYNISETNIKFYTSEGCLKILDYEPGDMNGDEVVNNKDMTRLFQYLSGWDVEVNEKALDINGDGVVNNKDLTRLFQYMSGWDVEIY